MTEREILYENGRFWLWRHPDGFYEIYGNGATHANRCGIIAYAGQRGLDMAKAEVDRRAALEGAK